MNFIENLAKRLNGMREFEAFIQGYNPFIPGDPLHDECKKYQPERSKREDVRFENKLDYELGLNERFNDIRKDLNA